MWKTHAIVVFIMFFISSIASASEADLQKQINELREEMSRMSSYYESKIKELEGKISEKDKASVHKEEHTPEAHHDEEKDKHTPEAHHDEDKDEGWLHKHHHGLLGGKVNIIGALDARYINIEKDKHTLMLHEAKIGAQVNIAEWLMGFITITKHHKEDVDIEEAYVKLCFDELGLTAKPGKFFVKFGPENQAHFFNRRTITLSAMHEGLLGNEPWADTGVQVDWKMPLEFNSVLSAAIVNGNNASSFGDGENTVSNNNFPIVSSWQSSFHTEYGFFELGPSFSWGQWDRDDKNNVYLLGGNAYWKLDNFDVQMEFIYRYKEQSSEVGEENAYGYYIWGAYTLPLEYNYLKGIEFLTSFGQFIPDGGNSETRVTPQVCLLINEYAKLRASYEVRYQKPKDRKDNRFITQFALAF